MPGPTRSPTKPFKVSPTRRAPRPSAGRAISGPIGGSKTWDWDGVCATAALTGSSPRLRGTQSASLKFIRTLLSGAMIPISLQCRTLHPRQAVQRQHRSAQKNSADVAGSSTPGTGRRRAHRQRQGPPASRVRLQGLDHRCSPAGPPEKDVEEYLPDQHSARQARKLTQVLFRTCEGQVRGRYRSSAGLPC